jgi:hypothetical protein
MEMEDGYPLMRLVAVEGPGDGAGGDGGEA